MRISPSMGPAMLGGFAISATTVALILDIVLALPRPSLVSTTRIIAVICSLMEVAVLASLSWQLFESIKRDVKTTGLRFGANLLLCAVTAALTVAALICLARDKILGAHTASFLAGLAVVLVFSFTSQLLFLVVRFVCDRVHKPRQAQSPNMEEVGRRSPTHHIKSIPYSDTSPPETKPRGSASMESKTPPSSSGGFSAAETLYSLQSSISNAVRPISSKTRLLSSKSSSMRSARRPASLDSIGGRDRSSTTEDAFDSWDTSAVDPQNRQAVLETSSPPPGRFLETIPASPTTSRSPSPGTPLDFEPPKRCRRSRSYSPASTGTRFRQQQQQQQQQQRSTFTQQTSTSESHIHPLFRSDSPVPPPAASPGTIVIAAPEAARVISDRQSIRSLNRMRSGSLTTAPSPLAQQGSFEEFTKSLASNRSSGTEGTESGGAGEIERKITPPIPEWILSAGSRTSLSGYFNRKTKESNDEEALRAST